MGCAAAESPSSPPRFGRSGVLGSAGTCGCRDRWARPQRQHGFTLIEVLVALAILAITTAFAFHALSGALDWTNRGTREESALLLAETIIGRVGRDIDLQPGEQDGRTEDGFVWHLRKTPYAGMAAMRRVERCTCRAWRCSGHTTVTSTTMPTAVGWRPTGQIAAIPA